MKLWLAVFATALAGTCIAAAVSDDGFTGLWKLNSARSDIHTLPASPDPYLNVKQTSKSLQIFASTDETGPANVTTYPLDGSAFKHQSGSSSTNTMTKWEGDALLVNTLVSGPANYTQMERWTKSRDGNTLTIKRTIVSTRGQTESVLIYENPAAPAMTSAKASPPVLTARNTERTQAPPPASDAVPVDYIVESGTRMLLRLTNAVNTKHTAAGDRIYLETAVPVFVNGRLIIPRGSYVTGTVVDSKRAGKVKGRSSIEVRFDSITLPNGIARDLRSRPSAADARGNVDKKEGKIEGDSNKGGDARTIGETTAAGAGIGSLAGAAAGHTVKGLGIGSAAGAAAGLAGVLLSRGPDVVLPAGTTMELTLDRDLHYTRDELRAPANP